MKKQSFDKHGVEIPAIAPSYLNNTLPEHHDVPVVLAGNGKLVKSTTFDFPKINQEFIDRRLKFISGNPMIHPQHILEHELFDQYRTEITDPMHNAHVDEEIEAFIADMSDIIGDQEHVEEPKNNYLGGFEHTVKFGPGRQVQRKINPFDIAEMFFSLSKTNKHYSAYKDWIETEGRILNEHEKIFKNVSFWIENTQAYNFFIGSDENVSMPIFVVKHGKEEVFKYQFWTTEFYNMFSEIVEMNKIEQQRQKILAAIEQKPEDEEPPKRRRM